MRLEEIEGIDHLATKDDLKLLALGMKADLAELKADLLKYCIGMQLTFATIILGAVYAMLSHWKP
jgi:hypothetical protein